MRAIIDDLPIFFTKIAAPMFKLLAKDVDFCWNDHCQIAFETLKAKLFVASVPRGPNWCLPFHISTDACDIAIGGVFGQRENQHSYAIYFISKNLTHAESNYTVTKKEFLAIVYVMSMPLTNLHIKL